MLYSKKIYTIVLDLFLNPSGHNGSTWAQHKMEHTQQYYNEITDIISLFSSPEDAYSKDRLKIRNSFSIFLRKFS